jgi:hypothetical protein
MIFYISADLKTLRSLRALRETCSFSVSLCAFSVVLSVIFLNHDHALAVFTLSNFQIIKFSNLIPNPKKIINHKPVVSAVEPSLNHKLKKPPSFQRRLPTLGDPTTI